MSEFNAETISIRKDLIYSEVSSAIHRYDQVIFLADGRCATSIALAELHPDKQFYAVDLEWMVEKEKFCQTHGVFNLHCITANIEQVDDCLQQLKDKGLNHTPTLVVMEGASYYIAPQTIQQWTNYATQIIFDCSVEHATPQGDRVPIDTAHVVINLLCAP